MDLTGTGSSFSSISVSNGIATGVDAVTQQVFNSPVANRAPGSIACNFSSITIPASGNHEVLLRVTLSDGNSFDATVEIGPGATKSQVRDAFITALAQHGFTGKANGDTGLEIFGKAGQEIKTIKFFHFGDFSSDPPVFSFRTKNSDGTYPVMQPGT